MIKRFSKNLSGNDYVEGDIHGRFDELMSRLKRINFDIHKDRLFSVGDLIDRGSQNEQTVELISKDWFF